MITVLMPVYGGERFLQEAIKSILNQEETDFELLIIDDASPDNSLGVIKKFTDPRIRVITNEKNLGLIGTLNKGLEWAKGELIARMDQDDIAHKDRLKKQKEFLEKNPEIVGIGTAMTLMNAKGETVGSLSVVEKPEQIRRLLTVTNPFAHPSMMVRRAAVMRVGMYSTHAYAGEDYDLWVRLSKVGPMSNLNEELLRYRLTPTGMSISLRAAQKATAEKIENQAWEQFGKSGPAPVAEWDEIWPGDRSHLTSEQLVAYAHFHLLFAKAYRKRGAWGVAFRHFVASFQWSFANRGSYFAILMFILPYRLYAEVEERIVASLNHARAGQLS